jgi:hypothetical protein
MSDDKLEEVLNAHREDLELLAESDLHVARFAQRVIEK